MDDYYKPCINPDFLILVQETNREKGKDYISSHDITRIIVDEMKQKGAIEI